MKNPLSALPALLIIATGLYACSGASKSREAQLETTQEKIENVKVTTLSSRMVGNTLEFSANTRAYEQVNLGPVSPGRIEKIYVEVGDRVKKGQLLIQMDQTSLLQARIQIATIEEDHKRYEALKESGAISQQVYDQSLANLNVQKTNLAYLEENTQIKAPFDGIIAMRNFENGELYPGGSAILTLMETDKLKADINVPESYYPQIKKGMKAEVISDIYPDRQFEAEVNLIAPSVNPASRSFAVEMKIPNAKELLKPGMFVRIHMDLGLSEAILVPSQAVLKLQGSNERFVFLHSKGLAQRVAVKVGRRFDDEVELISDRIKAGDQLVVLGQARLRDGVKLNVID